jgi:hypothetical protein
MLMLYRGHSDMPAELHAKHPSIAAHKTLDKMRDEMDEDEERWVLTDETAAQLTDLVNDGHIVFKFSF